MLVILTGPTGSGKTDTSWELVGASTDLVFLDCDWFASRSQFSFEKLEDVESVYRAMSSQIGFHMNEGRKRFVLTLTLEMAAIFHPRFLAVNESEVVHGFRLFSRPDVIRARILGRDRHRKAEEASSAVHQLQEFERMFPDESTFARIDTSDLEATAVAGSILMRISSSDQA